MSKVDLDDFLSQLDPKLRKKMLLRVALVMVVKYLSGEISLQENLHSVYR